jgi:hypothetical protein
LMSGVVRLNTSWLPVSKAPWGNVKHQLR